MRHPTKTAINSLTKVFGLDHQPDMQDWEIQCSDPKRLSEFISYYHNSAKDDDERFTLMALILGSYEEYHLSNPPDPCHWESIKRILKEDRVLHMDHIEYYQCHETDNDDEMFPISRQMRELPPISESEKS